MATNVSIAARYCGPTGSANGGYTSGLLARAAGRRVEVTLRLPPPLERPLELRPSGDGLVLLDGEAVVAEAAPVGPLDLDVPAPVSVEDAREAERHSTRLLPEPGFPSCFSCGPRREPGDGLRILGGKVAGRDVWAATWVPAAEFADADGNVDVPVLWAGMDCTARLPFSDRPEDTSVLGRMALDARAPVPVERTYVVMSWLLQAEARKGLCADALLDDAGRVLAVARSTWIVPRT